jgi:tetratricopeptide (TPR) repeat protein
MKNVLAGLVAGLGLTLPAQAETLPVSGIYAAGEDAPSEVKLIALGNFGGRAGERLALAIDGELRRAVIDGEPWFDITFDSRGGERYSIDDREGTLGPSGEILVDGGPQAIMRGYASVEVGESDSGTKEVEECIRRDDDDKCVERGKVIYDCFDLNVALRPDVRLARIDGRLLYSRTDRLIASRRFCEDERSTPSVDGMLQGLIDQFAWTVRYDLAPSYLSQGYRVMESRKGIAKPDRKVFGNAVKLTKNDPLGACLAFAALEESNPQDVSVLFNVGLCEEGQGNLDQAAGYYRRVLALEPGKDYAEDGLRRIASRRRAERQLEIRYAAAGQ